MKRRPNFTVAEMDALIDAIAERRAVVSSASPGRVTKSMKEREWLCITSKVNETSSLHRTVAEVRKKWKNLRMVTKAKKEALLADLVHLCKTGEPSAAARQLNPVETRVMEILEAGGVGAAPRRDEAGRREESDSNASASALYDDDELTAASNSEILANASLGCLPAAGQQQQQQLGDLVSGCGLGGQQQQQQQQQQQAQAGKPSILSVVEALQRRLAGGGSLTPPEFGHSAEAPAASWPSPSPSSAEAAAAAAMATAEEEEEVEEEDESSMLAVGHCRCCCHDPRLLGTERRRLAAEREKVAALRDIVASLRDVAATMKSMMGGAGPPA